MIMANPIFYPLKSTNPIGGTSHGIVNGGFVAYENIDAYNRVGFFCTYNSTSSKFECASVDNGVMVACDHMINAEETIKDMVGATRPTDDEYAFVCKAAAVSTSEAPVADLWLINTPMVGYTFLQQSLSDPREFFNAVGRPCALKKVVKGDLLQFSAEAFASGKKPTDVANYTHVKIDKDGKLEAATGTPIAGATYFKVCRQEDMVIGDIFHDAWILECAYN